MADEGHSDVIELTSSTFEAETQDAGLMLVEFFAPWCLMTNELSCWSHSMRSMLGVAIAKLSLLTTRRQLLP